MSERGADGVEEASADDVPSRVDEDWGIVMRMLPSGWEAKATELGAVRRLRGFDSVQTLLRVLLMHLVDGCSLRQTAARARAGGLADVSDVALLNRLRGCGPWFEWMVRELVGRTAAHVEDAAGAILAGRRLRLVDGSIVCEPGATGSTWRVHYSLDLASLRCDEVHVTGVDEGESLRRFWVRPGEIMMADRGFANRRGLRHVLLSGGDVLMRMNLTNLPLEDARGKLLNVLARLRTLQCEQAGDWQALARDEHGAMPVRVCAYKKSAVQAQSSQDKLRKQAGADKRALMPQTLEAAAYVIVVTTLMQPGAGALMELYRRRWQIELAFKRLKSLLQLGHLRKTDPEGAMAWLQGKVLAACLIEQLMLIGERFSPWGYLAAQPGQELARPAATLTLA
jgi:hypothetical protein